SGVSFLRLAQPRAESGLPTPFAREGFPCVRRGSPGYAGWFSRSRDSCSSVTRQLLRAPSRLFAFFAAQDPPINVCNGSGLQSTPSPSSQSQLVWYSAPAVHGPGSEPVFQTLPGLCRRGFLLP